MDLIEQVTKDRANLVSGLEQMQTQYVQLGQRINQQSGALQYVDLLLERIKGEQNGAVPPPPDGE